jgi:UDP-N-acetylmuramoylalanine-D-glutamate ligase
MEHNVWKEKLFEAVAGLGEEGCAAVEFLEARRVKIG